MSKSDLNGERSQCRKFRLFYYKHHTPLGTEMVNEAQQTFFINFVSDPDLCLSLCPAYPKHSAQHLHLECVYKISHCAILYNAFFLSEYPVTPNITECRVYNWQKMICRWEPATQNTGIATNQTLYWTLL